MVYEDNNLEDNLKFLDKILSTILSKSKEYTISLVDLDEEMGEESKGFVMNDTFFEKLKNLFKRQDNQSEFSFGDMELIYGEDKKLINALLYLNSEGFILYNPKNKSVFITFKGIIKASSGFYKEYKRQKTRDYLQNYFWIVAILTFVAGWILKPVVSSFF